VPVAGMSPVAVPDAEEFALLPWVTWPVSPPWSTRVETLPFCAPVCVVSASPCALCEFELGGLSTVVGVVPEVSVVGVVSVVFVVVDDPPGGPVAVGGDPVESGLLALETMIVRVPFPVSEPGLALPGASPCWVAGPSVVTVDGPRVDWLSTGVPVSVVDVVVVVVSLVLGVTWPAVATGVAPVGWASAKAAGAERNNAIVAAEIATPPTPGRVQLGAVWVPTPSRRIRSTCSRRLDHDSVATSLSRMSTVARIQVRSSCFRPFDHDSATRGLEALTVLGRVRSTPGVASDHDDGRPLVRGLFIGVSRARSPRVRASDHVSFLVLIGAAEDELRSPESVCFPDHCSSPKSPLAPCPTDRDWPQQPRAVNGNAGELASTRVTGTKRFVVPLIRGSGRPDATCTRKPGTPMNTGFARLPVAPGRFLQPGSADALPYMVDGRLQRARRRLR
jgi:hypothetical protein